MPWWRIFKQDADESGTRDSESESQPPSGQSLPSPGTDSQIDPSDPAVRERRRIRLEKRIQNLEYDIAQAKSAIEKENRWNKRVAEIDEAIKQARQDLKRHTEPPGGTTPVVLPSTPVEIGTIQAEAPSDVRFAIDGVAFRFSEEIDWTERGEQRTEFVLRRFEGDVTNLIPVETPDDRYADLKEHLSHSIAALAELLRDNALEDRPQPEFTLYDLATPCQTCNSWRDFKDRCVSCQRREWKAKDIHAEVDRLLDERNSQLDEIARWRDALPVLQRQLESARQELVKYS